jgi:hypothetical protein
VAAGLLAAAEAAPTPLTPTLLRTPLGQVGTPVQLALPAVTTPTLPSLPPLTPPTTTAPSPTPSTIVHGAAAPTSTVYTGTGQVTALLPTTVTPAISFYDSTGSVITTVRGQSLQATAGTWTPIAPVVAVAPPGTASAALGLAGSPAGAAIRNATLATSPVAAAPAPVGPLHTAGNQIVDATGAPVVLRGVDFTDLDWSSAPSLSQEPFIQARSWGANVVRVSLVENYLVSGMCGYSSNYSSEVAHVVNWVTSLGMVALLDLHLSSVDCLPIAAQQMPDTNSITFWDELATQYRSNPLVAFNLFNEPHDISDSVWLNGGTAQDFVPYQAIGMQELYNTIRSDDASNLVFLDGNDWGSTVPSALLAGTNLVYSVHAYTCPRNTPPQCSYPSPYDPSGILDPWIPLSANAPVFIGEFGWPSTSDGAYLHNVITYAAARGWGWIAYNWTGPPDTFGLLAQQPASGPWQPSPSGMPVLQDLSGA